MAKKKKSPHFKTDCRIRTVVAALCNGNRKVCMWHTHSYGKFLVASGSLYGLAVQLNYQIFPQRGHNIYPFSKDEKRICNSGYGFELYLQITSLQFVWNGLTGEGLLKVELLSCLLKGIFTEGLMHQYTGTI